MIKSKDVKLFHELNLEREIIPSNYELFHTNNNKVKQDNIIHSIYLHPQRYPHQDISKP